MIGDLFGISIDSRIPSVSKSTLFTYRDFLSVVSVSGGPRLAYRWLWAAVSVHSAVQDVADKVLEESILQQIACVKVRKRLLGIS